MGAARIGYLFHIDPLTHLSDDMFDRQVREACARVIDRDLRQKTDGG